jgi:hypothetical protein
MANSDKTTESVRQAVNFDQPSEYSGTEAK